MLAEGDNAWLKLQKNGVLKHVINPNGTVTGRASHFKPNLAQVPATRAPYGKQCRELFTVPPDYVLVGSDLSGLELRCLAHFLNDGGDYAKEVIDGDVHTANMAAAGLATRDQAKTFIYALLYGAGNAKIGSIVGGDAAAGARLRQQFLDGFPAFASLLRAVKAAVENKGHDRPDLRKLVVRSEHAALNTAAISRCADLQEVGRAYRQCSPHPRHRRRDRRLVYDEVQIGPGKAMKMSSVISLDEARKRLESISNSEYQSEQTQLSDLTGAEPTDDPTLEEIADVIMAVAELLHRARVRPFTTKSDIARSAADVVALCASEDLLTTSLPMVHKRLDDHARWHGVAGGFCRCHLMIDTDILAIKQRRRQKPKLIGAAISGRSKWICRLVVPRAPDRPIMEWLGSNEVLLLVRPRRQFPRKSSDEEWPAQDTQARRLPRPRLARDLFDRIQRCSRPTMSSVSSPSCQKQGQGDCGFDDKDLKTVGPSRLYRPMAGELRINPMPTILPDPGFNRRHHGLV